MYKFILRVITFSERKMNTYINHAYYPYWITIQMTNRQTGAYKKGRLMTKPKMRTKSPFRNRI